MKIKRLVIENFKSIERIELVEPNPFTVFVGPNGSGKSNIFEALEFVNLHSKTNSTSAVRLFGGKENIVNRNESQDNFHFDLEFNTDSPNSSSIDIYFLQEGFSRRLRGVPSEENIDYFFEQGNWESYDQFYNGFGKLFIGSRKVTKLDFQDDQLLNTTGTNLESVLKRILVNNTLRAEIFEWLELFVPGFKAIEIDDRNELHWFEESTTEYFTKDLISDGTYNILALLTAVYQSDDKPQFLCIEEPENGLHPQVARELVDFFRIMCEERGHYIWLNTHSQSMVSRLKADEMVVVEKKEGATRITQFKGRDMHGLRMDEALLMNVLGVGLAW